MPKKAKKELNYEAIGKERGFARHCLMREILPRGGYGSYVRNGPVAWIGYAHHNDEDQEHKIKIYPDTGAFPMITGFIK